MPGNFHVRHVTLQDLSTLFPVYQDDLFSDFLLKLTRHFVWGQSFSLQHTFSEKDGSATHAVNMGCNVLYRAELNKTTWKFLVVQSPWTSVCRITWFKTFCVVFSAKYVNFVRPWRCRKLSERDGLGSKYAYQRRRYRRQFDIEWRYGMYAGSKTMGIIHVFENKLQREEVKVKRLPAMPSVVTDVWNTIPTIAIIRLCNVFVGLSRCILLVRHVPLHNLKTNEQNTLSAHSECSGVVGHSFSNV